MKPRVRVASRSLVPWILALAFVACGEADTAFSQARDTVEMSGGDAAITTAMTAMSRGQPWRAYQALSPVLADSARRTPRAVYLAATAASRWGGWRLVEKLLGREPWLDSLYGGDARTLLAYAALDRDADSTAMRHALLAVESSPDETTRGTRLVLLARAFDRLDRRDSAAATYLRAATHLLNVSDWLLLRAAGVTTDGRRRDSLYTELRTEVARSRSARVEASVRERFGDLGGAARAYEQLGDTLSALRLRLTAARTPETRGQIRRQLIALVRSRPATEDARTAVEIVDEAFERLSAADELAIARSLSGSSSPGRAAAGFRRAFGARAGTLADRFTYGTVLSRLSRPREAAAQFARTRRVPALAAAAAYQNARSLVARGKRKAARTMLRSVVRTYPRDTVAAAALMLLSEMAMEDSRDGDARAAYRQIAVRHAESSLAPRARFMAALLALIDGKTRVAALEMDSLGALFPAASDLLAATYWAGRAWAQAGDTLRARERWRAVLDRNPLSYYGTVSARRLGEQPWAPPSGSDHFPSFTDIDSAMTRANLLERIGMDSEARFEYDALVRSAGASRDRMIATAHAFRERGLTSRAIQLGWRAIAGDDASDAGAYRLVYPLVYQDAILAEARDQNLDPALVAALIRQESSFNPGATSGAGARGLMQVMPAVGRLIARSVRFPDWNPGLLYQPDINIQLGSRHFANFARYYDDAHALAAYNAGESRIRRWSRRRGVRDPEVFIERIPFTETRDYVRIVLRNRDMYRALYVW